MNIRARRSLVQNTVPRFTPASSMMPRMSDLIWHVFGSTGPPEKNRGPASPRLVMTTTVNQPANTTEPVTSAALR